MRKLSFVVLVLAAMMTHRLFADGRGVLPADTSASSGKPADAEKNSAPVESTENAQATNSTATLAEANRLSEDLIYSVSRSPEHPFDAARAVEVITSAEIARRSGRGLGDILTEVAGVYVKRGIGAGGAAVVRGLAANQVLILVDGIKLTNGTWGDENTDHLNLMNVSQIERVEIVRGVVSVLGTESLGGIINIITKKGHTGSDSISGTVGLGYSSSDGALSVPVTLAGQTGKLRYSAGLTLRDANDLRGGGDVGKQAVTGYQERSGSFSAQYLVSADKTLTAMYSDMEKNGMRVFGPGIVGPIDFKPVKTQLASVSYLDLTSRAWADSFRASGYWNRQSTGVKLLVATPLLHVDTLDADSLFGISVEGGKFVGTSNVHHLVYGVDFSSEKTTSEAIETNPATGAVTTGRATTTPGAKYQTFGVYLNDRFDVGKHITVSAGARFGLFALKGHEVDDAVGAIDLDTTKSDFAGSLNVVYRATSSLNLIANAIRGFRTPNIYDTTSLVWGANRLQVPNADVSTEHVTSYELGAKYATNRFSGSAFLFRNDLTNLLVPTAGTLNGLPFYDSNHNGTRDPWETFIILQNKNVGAGTIEGIELDARMRLLDTLNVRANYTRTVGTNTVLDEPLPFIPPAFGSVTLQFNPVTRHNVWSELVFSFAGAQTRLSSKERADTALSSGTPASQVWSIRGGASLTDRISMMVEVENLLNEKYRYHGAYVYEPGRQLILSTQYRF